MKHTNDLEKDSIYSLVIKLTIPSMIAQFVNVLYSIVDRIYIGNIPIVGDLALAGAGICGPIVTLLSSFGTLIGLGGSILFSIRLGEDKKDSAKQILNNCFLTLVILSLILTLSFLFFKNPLLYLFGASDQIFPYANTYLTIYTAGTFFALMSIGLNYFIISQGYSLLSMATVLIGAVLNILLDPLFIFAFDMGIAGAAIATVIAQIASCIFVLFILSGKKIPIRLGFGGYDLNLIKRVVWLGLSPFLILATDSVILIALNSMLQKYGGKAHGDMLIACATIIQSYMLLITAPMLGITSGSQPLISFNYGAKQPDRVKQTVKIVLVACLLFTTTMFFISRVLPHYFVQIFTSDPTYIKTSIWGIKVFTAAIIPLSFQYTFVDSLTAIGATHVSLTLSLLRKGSYLLMICVLPLYFSAQSAFYAEPIADTFACIVTSICFLLLFQKFLYGSNCKA